VKNLLKTATHELIEEVNISDMVHFI